MDDLMAWKNGFKKPSIKETLTVIYISLYTITIICSQ